MRSNKNLNVVDQVPDTGKFIKQVMYCFVLLAFLFTPEWDFFQDSDSMPVLSYQDPLVSQELS